MMIDMARPSYEELEQKVKELENKLINLEKIRQVVCPPERELGIRSEIARVFLTVPNNEIYAEVLRVVLEAMESKYGFFGYIDQQGVLVCPSLTTDIWDHCQVSRKVFVFPPQTWGGIWGQALKEQRTLCSSGPFHVPEGHVPITNAMAVPIVYRKELIGVIVISNKDTAYSEADQQLLEKLADAIAPILATRLQRDVEEQERKQAEEILKARQREIEELNASLEQRVQEELEKSRQKDRIMIHQSRLAAMGEMIGLIAHQWRQPLNALHILLYNIKDSFDSKELNDEAMDAFIENGVKLTNKMSTTIDDFRNFFKPQKRKEKFCINKVIKDTLFLVQASFRYSNISVVLNEQKEIYVVGVPNEYSQVFLNVLNNARDAIVLRGVKKGEVKITVFRTDDLAVVKVRDNGGGIPENIMGRIFNPYVTTKAEEGTGLGLYLSKVIIEDHMDGSIDVKNIDEGAEFSIATPCGLAQVNGQE